MNILLLEDDEAIGIGLEYALKQEGYQVVWVKTVQEALTQLGKGKQDLYLLDLTLPDGSGYQVCSRIKEEGDRPVIFLTAFDDEVNVVMGLELGADDYISKPFRVRELMARIKTVMRRYTREMADGTVRLKDLEIRTNEARVFRGGQEIELTAMEYKLLLTLVTNRGVVMTRSRLLENMWDIDGDFVGDNTLTVYIRRLRNKIEEDAANPVYIKTVRGLGYTVEHE